MEIKTNIEKIKEKLVNKNSNMQETNNIPIPRVKDVTKLENLALENLVISKEKEKDKISILIEEDENLHAKIFNLTEDEYKNSLNESNRKFKNLSEEIIKELNSLRKELQSTTTQSIGTPYGWQNPKIEEIKNKINIKMKEENSLLNYLSSRNVDKIAILKNDIEQKESKWILHKNITPTFWYLKNIKDNLKKSIELGDYFEFIDTHRSFDGSKYIGVARAQIINITNQCIYLLFPDDQATFLVGENFKIINFYKKEEIEISSKEQIESILNEEEKSNESEIYKIKQANKDKILIGIIAVITLIIVISAIIIRL